MYNDDIAKITGGDYKVGSVRAVEDRWKESYSKVNTAFFKYVAKINQK